MMRKVIATTVLIITGSIIIIVPGGVVGREQHNFEQQVCYADGTCRVWDAPHPLTNNPLDECGVYMAPSTLGDDTNMGIYTGINLKQGDLINFPEIAIPLLFREWGEHTAGYNNDGVLWDRYIWEGNVVQLQSYDNTNIDTSRSVFVPGVGCTINAVLDMNNLLSVYTSRYDNLYYHRTKDPGTGAFSPYCDAETKVATEHVDAGSELFANYGDTWIPSIPGAQVSNNENLFYSEEWLLKQFYPFIEQHNTELTSDMKQSLYDFVTKDFPIRSLQLSTLPRFPWSDIEQVILERKDQPVTVLQKMTNTKPKPDEYEDDPQYIVKEFMSRQARRNITWLQQYGYCQDHIQPGQSTIPQAGRGAFATRNLPKGTVVGYSPLIHIGIHGRDIMTVDIPQPDGTMKSQYDLIINYSFGHRNSTVLLTPYGGMINYINHASDRTTNNNNTPYQPNVVVRWPNKELIAHKPWYLHRTPYDLKNTIEKIGLSFEYVAIRDIQKGEEVFMDYGIEWEQAWNKHVQTYRSVNPEYDTRYIHTSEWNETIFRTRDELVTNPYPPNFEIVCMESYTSRESDTIPDTYEHYWIENLRTDTPHRRYCSIVERYPNDASDSDENEYRYTVELTIPKLDLEEDDDDDEDAEVDPNKLFEKVVVRNVPSSAIFLVDTPWSADWHLPTTFRHEIRIPDDIMPKAWLNGIDDV